MDSYLILNQCLLAAEYRSCMYLCGMPSYMASISDHDRDIVNGEGMYVSQFHCRQYTSWYCSCRGDCLELIYMHGLPPAGGVYKHVLDQWELLITIYELGRDNVLDCMQ